jgi:hypothetical protein
MESTSLMGKSAPSDEKRFNDTLKRMLKTPPKPHMADVKRLDSKLDRQATKKPRDG